MQLEVDGLCPTVRALLSLVSSVIPRVKPEGMLFEKRVRGFPYHASTMMAPLNP
jgi:hypothetical protein